MVDSERSLPSPRGAPKFSEAYPRLNFIHAQAAIAKGKTVCLFERGTGLVGSFEFLGYERSAPMLVMKSLCNFAPTLNQDLEMAAEYNFLLEKRPIGVAHEREYARCQRCGAAKAVLIYARKAWACGTCHGLLNRSTLLDPDVRLAEKVAALEARLSGGRPKGMHNATFQTQRKLLQELQRKLARHSRGAEKVASVEHNRVVVSRWLTPAEARSEDLGWTITD